MSVTVGEIRRKTVAWFTERGVPTPEIDADWLLSAALKIPRLQVLLQFERPLSSEELARIRALVARRGKREPLAWILGERGFHNVELYVDADVLDPRPDTETLVEAALELLPLDAPEPVYLADVGCGTGAVGLAIAAARPQVRLYATDLSEAALENTRRNVARLDLGARVAVLRGDLLSPIPADRPIDWVVSNPPYIPSGAIEALMPEVSTWEPRVALDGGPDGLQIVRRLADRAASRARRGFLVEIGHDQGEQTAKILRQAGFEGVRVLRDLAGRQRVVTGLSRSPSAE
ncbi:MAG: peptide chain release factor N(5)-glutamine methyltransferase [Deltaproteobacteria bacterium]|nr:MAG: peptide chain release factor N(5)-glutamine methyltransferase [Deltaproteobacteria bacterium]